MLFVSIAKSKQLHFNPEGRLYSPHLTLARLRMMEFRKIEPEERPQIHEEVSLTIPVASFEIMGSTLKRFGPEYTILQSVALNSKD